MKVFQRTSCEREMTNLSTMVLQVSPDLTVYQDLHLGVLPRLVGAAGRGYEVPSMTVAVAAGPAVVVVGVRAV